MHKVDRTLDLVKKGTVRITILASVSRKSNKRDNDGDERCSGGNPRKNGLQIHDAVPPVLPFRKRAGVEHQGVAATERVQLAPSPVEDRAELRVDPAARDGDLVDDIGVTRGSRDGQEPPTRLPVLADQVTCLGNELASKHGSGLSRKRGTVARVAEPAGVHIAAGPVIVRWGKTVEDLWLTKESGVTHAGVEVILKQSGILGRDALELLVIGRRGEVGVLLHEGLLEKNTRAAPEARWIA